MNFSEEMIQKAKQAASAAELMDIAKKHSVELTEEEASAYYAQLNPVQGELDDDRLESVAGGMAGPTACDEYCQHEREIDNAQKSAGGC